MRKWLHSMSMWFGVFTVVAMGKIPPFREWTENPLCLLAVFTIAATVNHLTQDE